jgi:hypothetical protein
MSGTPIDWPDEGGVHYSRQFGTPVLLRAFAAWHDHRTELPEFTGAPEGNFYQHPVWKLPKPPRRRFPTLVEHTLHTGYFLPVPFEGHYEVEPFTVGSRWKFFYSVASTQTILRELGDLLEFMAAVPEFHEPEIGPGSPPPLRWYAEELQSICNLSVEHRLPVIFYG